MGECCEEPGCTRTQPMGLMKADFSGRWYVVTKRRDYKPGSRCMVAQERHELPLNDQVQLDQMRSDSSWLKGLLAAMEMTKDELAAHLGVVFHDRATTGEET